MSQTSTIGLLSQDELGFQSGGGNPFIGGIVIHNVRRKYGEWVRSIEDIEKEGGRGLLVPYDWCGRVFVDNNEVWVNRNLVQDPAERQDVVTSGKINMVLFRTQKLNSFIAKYGEYINQLGINIR